MRTPKLAPTRACVAAVLLIACGGTPSQEAARPPIATHAGTSTSAPNAPSASAPAPIDSAEPTAPPAPTLGSSTAFSATRIFEQEVAFLITGEQGRLAVLAKEGAATVPHRFEAGAWKRLDLPEPHRNITDPRKLGIYFGRDNRPRLMGYRLENNAPKMVYLRHRDGKWQDQRSEIGALASESAVLFGVLGEADPEVVCSDGHTCLIKSRKGWKEIPSTLPTTAVVRAFGLKGYAVTAEGVFRADEKGFTKLGPPAAWKGPATGFWVGPDETIAVAVPSENTIYVLDAGGNAWRAETSPVTSPFDVAGPAASRWIAGGGGLVHREGDAYRRVGDPSWSLDRIIVVGNEVFAGGRAGVVVAKPAN
ncbi:MAG: hypothetical protein HOW73_14430 [Polyangiaceae bacterium]|nr:hypothetical protein [Polyangiaceae bacterium]